MRSSTTKTWKGPTLAHRIVVENVSAGYGAVRVLHGVSIEVNDGETVVLLGTNGNGKSTLIKCIMGIVEPDEGEIYLEADGERISLVGRKPEEIVNMGVTLVPEGRRLFPLLTVEENLLLGAYREEARRDIDRNLAFSFEALPGSQGTQEPARRQHERGRAADAGRGPRLDVRSPGASGG